MIFLSFISLRVIGDDLQWCSLIGEFSRVAAVHELSVSSAPQVLNFTIEYESVLHGLGGYFECTLYKDIMLSILPSTHSSGRHLLVFHPFLLSF
jgi:hypothetical protein